MKLVALSGRKSSGKDTVARLIELVTYRPYQKIKFAGKLKEMVSVLVGCELQQLEDYDFKEKSLGDRWGNINPRQILQEMGSCGRGMYEDIWVVSALSNLVESGNYIVSDLRYLNEAAAVKKLGGLLVRIERPDLSRDDVHASETSLDNFQDWDYVIHNDGKLQDLAAKVQKMCKDLDL